MCAEKYSSTRQLNPNFEVSHEACNPLKRFCGIACGLCYIHARERKETQATVLKDDCRLLVREIVVTPQAEVAWLEITYATVSYRKTIVQYDKIDGAQHFAGSFTTTSLQSEAILKNIFCVLFISTVLLNVCTPLALSQPTSTPVSTSTDIPAPTAPPTLIPPTPSPRFINLKSGGFSLSVQPDLDFDIDDYSINISDKQGELLISLNGKPYIASSYTLESFLGKYVAEMAARGGTLTSSEPYEIIIDGISGIAVDLTGSFLDNLIAGKAIIISPGKDFVVFGLGMSNLSTHTNGWDESGRLAFEMLINSIKFKAEVKDE